MATRKYPPLPKELDAPCGPVTILRQTPIVCEGVTCWGLWRPETRTITIDSSATMAHQWRVLLHELAHVAFDDSGLSNGMHEDLVEACCDAISTARFRERFS